MNEQNRAISLILLPASEEKEFHASLDLLAGLVSKSKTDAELIVCIPEAQQKTWETSSKGRSVAEAIAKGRLQTVNSSNSSAEGLKLALPLVRGAWIYAYHPQQASAATNMLNWFITHGNKISDDMIWFVPPPKEQYGLGVIQRLLKWKGNLIHQLGTASGVKDYSSKAFLIRSDKAVQLFSDLDSTGLNIFTEVFAKAQLNGISTGTAVLAMKTNPYRAYSWLGEAWAALLLVIRVRWYWYFKKPLKEMKRPGADITDGNASLWRLCFFVIFMLGLILMPLLSFDFGVTWDEKAQMSYGHAMLKFFTSFGEDNTVFDTKIALTSHLMYYGSFFDLLAAFVNEYISPLGEFETRHLLNSLFGLMAMAYAALTAREAGSWRTAVIAFLFILITPQFFGQSMNNPKDIPFAAGYIFSIYHMVRFLKQLPNPRTGTILFLILGIALTTSMRVGGLLLLGFLGLFTAAEWLMRWKKAGAETMKLIPHYARYFIIIAIASYFIGIIFWPYGIIKPFVNPFKALKEFTNFSLITSHEIFEGVRINMAHVPWYYTIKYIGITVPLVVLAGLLPAFFLLPVVRKKFALPMIGVMLFVSVFPVFYAAYKSSMLYNGWRHFLFIYAPLVVVAACGWDVLVELIRPRAVKIIFIFLPMAGLAAPLVWMVRNHPNEYVYFNESVGGLKGAYSYYETDYYGNSVKQAIGWLLKNEPVIGSKRVVVATNNEPLNASYYSSKYSDSIIIQWTRDQEWYAAEWDYAIYTSRTMTPTQLRTGQFPPKESVHVVYADGVPLVAVLKKHNDYLSRANTFMRKLMFDSAVVEAKKALAYNPRNEEAQRLIGGAYVNLHQDALARVHLNKALELMPENYEAYDLFGLIAFNNKKYTEALKFFRKAYGIKVNFSMAWYHAATALMNLSRPGEAIAEYEGCIKQNGKLAEVYMPLGQAYLITGNYAKCIEAETAALSINPKLAIAYELMSDAYSRLGNKEYAEACAREAQRLRSEAK